MAALPDTYDVEVTVTLKIRVQDPSIHNVEKKARQRLKKHGLDKSKWDSINVETWAATAFQYAR